MDWDEIDRELATLGEVPASGVAQLVERYGERDRSLARVDAALAELANGAQVQIAARVRDRASFRTLQGVPPQAISPAEQEPDSEAAPEPRVSALPLGWVAEAEEQAQQESAFDEAETGSIESPSMLPPTMPAFKTAAGELESFEIDARGDITVTAKVPQPEPPKKDALPAWLMDSEPPPALDEPEPRYSQPPADEPSRAFAPPVDDHADHHSHRPMERMEDDFSPPVRRSSVPVRTPSERPPSLRPEVAALLDQALDPSEFPPPRASRSARPMPSSPAPAAPPTALEAQDGDLEMLVDDEDIIELDDEELIDDDGV